MSFARDMNAAKAASQDALEKYHTSLSLYHAACACFDFERAELARLMVEEAIGIYLDHVKSQYLRLQKAGGA